MGATMKRLRYGAAVVAVVLALGGAGPGWGQGIPVIDSANLTQSVVSAVEDVAQTLHMVEQYSTQLQQYATQLQQLENMVLNTEQLAAVDQIFTAAQTTMTRLNGLSNTLAAQKSNLGSLDTLLAKFKDQSDYQTGCLGLGCSSADQQAQTDSRRFQSNAQKLANEAVLRGADQQATDMQADAQRLESLQSSVRNAQGQLQAVQANGQLGAAQADQLLKIRSLLVAQSNAQAIRDQTEVDRKAQEAEAAARLRGGSFAINPGQSW
jgi:type IV secretion system protein TrbJ